MSSASSVKMRKGGFEFMIASTSVINVCSSSNSNLPLPMVLQRHLFTIHPKILPDQGAFSRLKLHCTHTQAKYSFTVGRSRMDDIILPAALNVSRLLERLLTGSLFWQQNI